MRGPFVVVVAVMGCAASAPTQEPAVTPAPVTTTASVATAAAPFPDSDGDRIVDRDDKCPTEPETYNGVDDDDGCPDHGKVVVIATANPPAVERVRFAKGSSKPLPQSTSMLALVADVLKQHPEVELVQIEGHASASEKAAVQLSQQRADAVRAAVIAEGIDGKRLRAKGFGAHCPFGDTDEVDQRVEFKIVTQSGKPTAVALGCAAATAAGVVSGP